MDTSARVNAAPTAYINAKVYTSNPEHQFAEAFIVKDGDYVAIGSTTEIQKAAPGYNAALVDLHGAFVMSALHDAHTHLLIGSMQKLYECHMGMNATVEETITALKAHKEQHTEEYDCHAGTIQNWLIGNYYNNNMFPDNKPDRSLLDKDFPDIPVVIRSLSCHDTWVNTAALNAAKIEKNSVAPRGGRYIRRSGSQSSLTGEIVDTATEAIWMGVPKRQREHYREALLYGVQMANRFGIISVQEASANSVYLQACHDLEQKGLLTCHIATHIVHSPLHFAAEARESLDMLLDNADEWASEHVQTHYVKFWLDGAPFPPNTTHCSLNENGDIDRDALCLTDEIFLPAMARLDKLGKTIKVHCAGTGSIRYAVNAIETLRKNNPSGPRHELAHCNDVHPSDLSRMASLNITAELSPAMWHMLPEDSPAPLVFPFPQIRQAGVNMSIGSDWILTPTCNLFPGLAAVIKRKNHGLDLETILLIITIEGFRAVQLDHRFGSVEKGKSASFIILDTDLFSSEDITRVKVMKTYLHGNVIYDRSEDPLSHLE